MNKVTEAIIRNGRSGGAGKGDKRRLGEDCQKIRENWEEIQGFAPQKINGKVVTEEDLRKYQ